MKDEIRNKMMQKRNNLSFCEVQSLSNKIFENLKPILNKYNKFFVYVSFSKEVDTKKIINYLLDYNKEVYVPKIENKNMFAVKIDNQTEFRQNKFNIFEPVNCCFEKNFDNFVCLTPCLATDLFGNRIGYGGGYYDKFLSNKNSSNVALCYSFQILPKIESEIYDIKMDKIITENEVINI